MEKIKACPFCGSFEVERLRTNPGACWIRCLGCCAESASSPNGEEAIEFWNRRYRGKKLAKIIFDDEKEPANE